jgi:hypothetical protein
MLPRIPRKDHAPAAGLHSIEQLQELTRTDLACFVHDHHRGLRNRFAGKKLCHGLAARESILAQLKNLLSLQCQQERAMTRGL